MPSPLLQRDGLATVSGCYRPFISFLPSPPLCHELYLHVLKHIPCTMCSLCTPSPPFYTLFSPLHHLLPSTPSPPLYTLFSLYTISSLLHPLLPSTPSSPLYTISSLYTLFSPLHHPFYTLSSPLHHPFYTSAPLIPSLPSPSSLHLPCP